MARQSPIQLQLEENVLQASTSSDRNVNGTSSFLATQVAALKSRDLAERVIRSTSSTQNEAFLQSRRRAAGARSRVGGGLLSLLRPRGLEPTCGGRRSARTTLEHRRRAERLLDRYMS